MDVLRYTIYTFKLGIVYYVNAGMYITVDYFIPFCLVQGTLKTAKRSVNV